MRATGALIIALLVTSILCKAQDTMYMYKSGSVLNKQALASIDSIVFYKAITGSIAVLTTGLISNITATTAICGGNITSDGGLPITARGVCWSTATNPTIALSTKTSDGYGTGGFISSIVGLTVGTKYYVRAFATNSAGTTYGSEVTFTTGVSSYDDPHKDEYYIEYYENGIYHKLNWGKVTSWQFFNNLPIRATGGCLPTYHSYSSGPTLYTSALPAYTIFSLQINRQGFSSLPEVGVYQISRSTEDTIFHSGNSGNCDLIIDGAGYGCDLGDKDSYIKVNITEVKVDQDLGLEKRGYYKGEFDAILYFAPAFGVYQKRVITGGRFMAPIGNIENASLNGSAPPAFDRFAALTTGKWYWRPMVEDSIFNQDYGFFPCNLDDYWVFRVDGTMDCRDGGIQCEPHYSGIEYWDNISWVFENNQNIINLESGALRLQIVELSDSILDFGSGFRLAHGN